MGNISAKSNFSLISRMKVNKFWSRRCSGPWARAAITSSLLANKTTGIFFGNSSSTCASAWLQYPDSTTKQITSTSAMVVLTVRFITLFMALLYLVWNPGVSTKINCAVSVVWIPKIRWRVVCAFLDVILTFMPTMALSKVDLPTLGRPTKATVPHRKVMIIIRPTLVWDSIDRHLD